MHQDGNPGKEDDRTGLTEQTKESRIILAREFSSCLTQNRKWAIVRTDIDNLKGANNIDHDFGNAGIAQGISSIARALYETSFNKNAKVYLIRQAEADEATIVILDPTDEELDQLQNNLTTALQPININIKTPEKEVSFSFSSTMSMLRYNDERITKEEIENAKTHVKQYDKPAFDLFNRILTLADDEVKIIKGLKDIKRFPIGLNLLLSTETKPEDFKTILTEALGGTRISGRLFGLVLDAYAIKIRLSSLNLPPQEPIVPETDLNKITDIEKFVTFMEKYLADRIAKEKLAN